MSLWLFAVFLVVYINQTQKEMAHFDPFEILGVSSSATPSEIKKAYFQLSRIYHPDKASNPRFVNPSSFLYADFKSRASQVLCRVFVQGISSANRSSLERKLSKIWTSRWTAGKAKALVCCFSMPHGFRASIWGLHCRNGCLQRIPVRCLFWCWSLFFCRCRRWRGTCFDPTSTPGQTASCTKR